MAEEISVFVLGAGAGKRTGMPDGEALLENLADALLLDYDGFRGTFDGRNQAIVYALSSYIRGLEPHLP